MTELNQLPLPLQKEDPCPIWETTPDLNIEYCPNCQAINWKQTTIEHIQKLIWQANQLGYEKGLEEGKRFEPQGGDDDR